MYKTKAVNTTFESVTAELKIFEFRYENMFEILLGCGYPLLAKPRRNLSCLTTIQQLETLRSQLLQVKVNYKQQISEGTLYGRRYAVTTYYPPILSM